MTIPGLIHSGTNSSKIGVGFIHSDGMSFEDLPDDWSDHPLSTPGLAIDVVDLFFRGRDRAAGALLLLLCDAQHRLLQPIVIDDVPWLASQPERSRFFDGFLGHFPEATMVAAVSSRFMLPPGVARGWRESAEAALGDRLIAFFTAVPNAVVEVPAA